MPINARSYFGLLVLGLGTLVGPLDSSVNIAFPYITGAFGVPLEDIRWVIVSYVLTYSSLMLVFGKLGDLFGHRLIFTAGLLVSAIAFVLCATATEFSWLLAFRVAQGIGASLVLSCGPAIATLLFPEQYRSRVLGIYLMMFGIGGVLGPSIGGMMVAVWDWPAVFWFRVPISVLTLLFVFILPKPSRQRDAEPFDTFGAALLAIAVSALLLTVTQLQHAEETPLLFAILVVLTGSAAWLYTRRSRNQNSPVIRMRIFRDVPFAVFNLAGIAVNLTGFAILLLVPYYLSEVSGFSVGLGGFVLALSAIATMLASPAGGWLIGRFAANRMAFAGIALVGLSSICVGLWSDTPPIWAMSAPLILSGLGIGFFQVSYMSTITGTLPVSERGVAGSLALLTRTIGVVCSASFLTWAFSAFSTHHATSGMDTNASFLAAFQSTFIAVGTCLLVFLFVTCVQPSIWFGRQTKGTET